MEIGKAILYVLAILAIVAVAGLVIYLLSCLIVSIVDKKEVKAFSSEKDVKELNKSETLLLEDKKVEELAQPVEENKEEYLDASEIDLDLADQEKRAIENNRNSLQERQKVVNSEPEEQEDFDDEDINALYQRMIAEINAEASDEKEEAEEVEEVEEEVVEEPKQPTVEEMVSSVIAASEAEEVEEPVVDEEKEQLKALVEELKSELQKEQTEKAKLEEEKATLEEEKATAVTEAGPVESLESLNSRLVILQQRLSAAEKELKTNKKEYLPLFRINKNLERDQAKLRRKEAIVAKQKVMLFGVNNYVVDPEKEKKLSEDLDVLDALRLSVQHCEEVMQDNKDRYPILAKTNEILTKQVADLKADIEDVKKQIANYND